MKSRQYFPDFKDLIGLERERELKYAENKTLRIGINIRNPKSEARTKVTR